MADFSSIGKQTSRNFTDLYRTAQRNSPDVNKLVKTANDIEYSKKVASMQARHGLQQVGFAEVAAKNTRDMQKKLNEDVKDILAPSQRFAGLVAGLGALSTGAIMMKNNLQEQREEEELQKQQTELKQLRISLDAQTAEDNAKYIAALEKNNELRQQLLDSRLNSTPTQSTAETGSENVGVSTDQGPAIQPSGGDISRQAVYDYITKEKGLSHNHAYGLMANIDRESTFRPTVRSGDDGGPGGLFQWKGVRQTPIVARLVNSGDWKGQIDYALTEPGEPSAQTFVNTNWQSPQAAAAYWTRKWERPAHPEDDILKNNQFIAGYNYAN